MALRRAATFVREIGTLAFRRSSQYAQKRLPHALGLKVKYATSPKFREKLAYANALKTLPTDEAVILYESFHGSSMSDSPYAIFRFLLSSPDYSGLTHVWALTEPAEANPAYRHLPNVKVVQHGGAEYARYLASAKYLINNSTFPSYFTRKPDQIYLNTWHGVPLKRMFRHEGRTLTPHANSQRNLLAATHLVFPNAYTVNKLLDSADIEGIVTAVISESGSPRTDLVLSADRNAIRSKLGIADGKRVLLYAPTWRGDLTSIATEVDDLLHAVDVLERAAGEEFAVLVSVHNFLSGEEQVSSAIRAIPKDLDVNELLAAVDLLVTDYSSIMFDYMVLDRPLILYAYDRAEYEATRGLYLPLESVPGVVCSDPEELAAAVAEVRAGVSRRGKSVASELAPTVSPPGQATRRATEALFKPQGRYTPPASKKKKVLIYGGGWRSNGITTSLLNLTANIDYDLLDIYILTHGAEIDRSANQAQNVRRLDPRVHLIHRCGEMNNSLREQAVFERFSRSDAIGTEKELDLVRTVFERENRRLFGDTVFDVAVDFSGYSVFWASLICFSQHRRRVMYLHNDMVAEAQSRYPHLRQLFKLYDKFDKVVSVSQEVSEVNVASLRQLLGSECANFSVVNNTVGVRRILDSAADRSVAVFGGAEYLLERPEDAEVDSRISGVIRPDPNCVNFITIGRLSPEKGHGKLLQAFARLAKRRSDVRLYIVGEGPLRNELIAEATRLRLRDKVVFTGQLSNPFPLLAECDCFVLPSDYEGQPMVLLEALALGIPIVATDIPGSRSILGDARALLVENSPEGVLHGLSAFLSGTVRAGSFDAAEHNRRAVEMFEREVCGMPPRPAAGRATAAPRVQAVASAQY